MRSATLANVSHFQFNIGQYIPPESEMEPPDTLVKNNAELVTTGEDIIQTDQGELLIASSM